MRTKAVPVFLGMLITVLYALWLAWPITIITADIGRHIMDGRVFFSMPEWRNALLHTNFYSSATPEFSIINHHWASGIVFAAVHWAIGWKGLHVFSMLPCIMALLLFVRVGAKRSTPVIALSTGILLLPMVAYRLEVRPEFFGYFFAALVVYLAHCVAYEGGDKRLLRILPLVFVAWVNMHASFPVGLAAFGLICADMCIKKSPLRTSFIMMLGLSVLATCLNPYGISGAVYPFAILHDPGYAVAENQSLTFLASIGMKTAAFTYLKITTVLSVLATCALAYKKKIRDIWPFAAQAILLVLMSWLAVRHITVAALFLIPFFAYAFFHLTKSIPAKIIRSAGVCVLMACIVWQGYALSNRWLVLGLEPTANDAAEFMKENNVQGPIFNNFDIGGYAIYHFFPDIRPFVYNRPESHPSDFWRDTYVPSMQDPAAWNTLLAEQKFNAIVLFHGDRTTWAQKFLTDRIRDSQWAPVFVDRSIIVLLRQNGINAEIIRKYGINPATLLSH